MKKVNRRERRESCACTGRGSGSTMQRRSIARPSRHLPPPPSRTTMAQQLRSCCDFIVYNLPYAFGLFRYFLLPAASGASELSQ